MVPGLSGEPGAAGSDGWSVGAGIFEIGRCPGGLSGGDFRFLEVSGVLSGDC